MNAAIRVSVGMPVCNGAASIARAVEAVLAQTFPAFELIVADNASTDGTGAIVSRYAERDARVRYVRHATNMGAFENYRFVLQAAGAPYFMWSAADDRVAPTFLERAVAALDRDLAVVCAVPQVEFTTPDGSSRRAEGTFALLGTPAANVARFLRDPVDNSRFYGLFRREALLAAMPESGYYAFDWAISAGTLRFGIHVELDGVLLVRAASDRFTYVRGVDSAHAKATARLLPLWPFTRAILFRMGLPLSPLALAHLLRLNLVHHVVYCRYRYPRYGEAAFTIGSLAQRMLAAAWRAGGTLRGGREIARR